MYAVLTLGAIFFSKVLEKVFDKQKQNDQGRRGEGQTFSGTLEKYFGTCT